MFDLAYIIGCVVLAYAGSRFVVWAIGRNLPVPMGSFLWLRFLFWWMTSWSISFGAYAFAIYLAFVPVHGFRELEAALEPSILVLGGLISLGVPYWVGFFKGIDLQVTRRFSA